ncbi:MAG: hypothetical protein K8S16_20745, partial [Bacteroidales bacterium]|nr:hypothetical protein [Bacteroidales bacterium]
KVEKITPGDEIAGIPFSTFQVPCAKAFFDLKGFSHFCFRRHFDSIGQAGAVEGEILLLYLSVLHPGKPMTIS